MRFFSAWAKSLWQAQWIKDQRNQAKQAWKYFFLSTLLFTVVLSVPLAIVVPGLASDVQSSIVSNIPPFTAKISAGQLHVEGIKQPFATTVGGDGGLLVVVDTVSATSSLQNYLKDPNQSGLLFTTDRAELYNATTDQSRVQYWKDVPDTAMTKDAAVSLVRTYSAPQYVALIIALIAIGIYLGLALSRLVVVAVVGLLMYFACRIAGKDWTYGQLVVAGLYAITLPTIVWIIFPLVGLTIPYLLSLLFLAFMLAMVFTKEDEAGVNEA